MSKLLRAGFRRYTHSLLFWFGVAVSVGAGIFGGSFANSWYYLDDTYYMVSLLTYAVVISLLIGREFSDGIFRNKIIAGHSKGNIFLSETILALCAMAVMFTLCALCIVLFVTDIFSVIPFWIIALIYVGIFIITIVFVSLFVLVSCCISNKAIAGIVNILLVLALILGGYQLESMLNQPEIYEGYQMSLDENGEMVKTEYTFENPNYIRGTLRDVLGVISDISPFNQYCSYESIFSDMPSFPELTEEEYKFYEEFKSGAYVPSEETVKALTTLPFYQLALIVILLGSGYIIFRKKDFK